MPIYDLEIFRTVVVHTKVEAEDRREAEALGLEFAGKLTVADFDDPMMDDEVFVVGDED